MKTKKNGNQNLERPIENTHRPSVWIGDWCREKEIKSEYSPVSLWRRQWGCVLLHHPEALMQDMQVVPQEEVYLKRIASLLFLFQKCRKINWKCKAMCQNFDYPQHIQTTKDGVCITDISTD